ncbi:uncharacterized protein F4807DRAFT_457080 [Annulohypoxylon truncatum]|uniref:uncharacterized protein n=1 Tax=Annulohypoxylon truncatum TaxID=327061 RepID=UPI0020088BA0|nr:uncharacterized protein F4807DRAFT_457080 [Annulohypoxylon truncatum]KAI1212995.1 hypothetical protein F4807DRAFT_457080 [Annulohypoxylon truncatum]
MTPDGERSSRSNMDQSLSEAEPYPVEHNTTLHSIHERTTINSALRSNYATKWGPVEAFRELVQNWRDGIIQSFKLSEEDFKVILKENDDEIVYTAIAPSTYRYLTPLHECLGYIRWTRQQGAGTVDITNRQATIEPWHLTMGGTTKVADKNQVGKHGEGLKIALLVLMREPQNHEVRCHSGGFEWTFNFTSQRRLVANLVRMTPSTAGKAQGQAPVEASPNEDVQFLIGTISKGRNEYGYPTERTEVTRDEFKKWTKCALFLQNIPDADIVKTSRGDILMDPRFSGSIYLKGFLLKESTRGGSASVTSKALKHGYNFATGMTDREREFMASSDDESRAIMAIWERALSVRGELVGELHGLLISEQEYADVYRAEDFIHESTKGRIKSYIREKFSTIWYYTAKEQSSNHMFDNIVEAFSRTPEEVNQRYWAILKDSGFRTADEEEMKRFNEATTLPNTGKFQSSLRWLIRGGLEGCHITTGTDVMFVKADRVIHEKWSKMQSAMKILGQHQQASVQSVLLGAAQWLIRDALSQVPTHLFNPFNTNAQSNPFSRNAQWDPFTLNVQRILSQHQKQAIAESGRRIDEVIQILRVTHFEVYDCGTFNKLAVKWNKCAAWSTTKCQVTIQLHRKSTCWHVRDILNGSTIVSSNMTCCTHITEVSHKTFPATTCFTATIPFDKESFEVQVEKGQDYYYLMYNPEDLMALVAFCPDRKTFILKADGNNKDGQGSVRGIGNLPQAAPQSRPVVQLPPQSVVPSKVPSKRPWEDN